jgi:hypothetical protein
MSTLTNNVVSYTESSLQQAAIADLVDELGAELLIYAETPIPLWPFVALGEAIYDILSFFGGGKPVTVDTNNVIRAYNMSAYWPLHTLAADLSEMLKNGAPISDSRPEIQAQFGQLKQGTVQSIQSLAGAQPGPSGDGYWQIFNLIELSWQYAGDYNSVLKVVEGIDKFTIGLTQLELQNVQPPPAPPNVPPGPTAPPCPPFQALPDCLPQPSAPDLNLDEMGNGFAGVAYWLQVIAIYLMNIFQKGAGAGTGNGGNADPVTCTQLTGLFGQLEAAISAINISIPAPPPLPEPPAQVDLTAIDADLKNLQTTLADMQKCVCDGVNGTSATAAAIQAKWLELVQLNVNEGLIDAETAQIVTA